MEVSMKSNIRAFALFLVVGGQFCFSQTTQPGADSKPASGSADSFDKHYVVSVIGLRASGRQNGRNESLRDQLLTTTQLVRKNKTPIGPDDVKVKTEDGANEIQFFFPKTSPISIEDKEVTFRSVIGRMTVEDKFDLKKMTRSGRLELD